MGTSNSRVVVAVIGDDLPSRIGLGHRLQAAGFEPTLFGSAAAYVAAAPPIIVTTSRIGDVIGGGAEQNGCEGFFWKPIDGNALAATITTLADR